jgi:hypothetical protein
MPETKKGVSHRNPRPRDECASEINGGLCLNHTVHMRSSYSMATGSLSASAREVQGHAAPRITRFLEGTVD